ncbi:hypothetical protein BGZ51_003535 [Haplosporangium sp. Z 767]|nr:hypothetical protein BGZ51_003535 [Haplosporangium sp. Z 767]KAF9184622.1 hypothetical protein BGZ50_003576 [Haplosporangium sp. Z 11]
MTFSSASANKVKVPDPSSPLGSRVRLSLLVLLSVLLFQLTLSPKTSYLLSNIKNIRRPIHYHGQDVTTKFFEGWYIKMVKLNETVHEPARSLALIPGIYRTGPTVSDKHKEHAFVIVVGLPGPEHFAYYRFPTTDFVDLGSHAPGNENAFRIKIGNSLFAHDEVILDLPADHFEHVPTEELESFYSAASRQYERQYHSNDQSSPIPRGFFRDFFPAPAQLSQRAEKSLTIQGHVLFPAKDQTLLPTSRLMPSIMGITAYLPFLECNHGVASMYHPIPKGHITISYADNVTQAKIKFDGGVGYIEKDWGINFPSTWIWGQTNIFTQSPGSSLMMSVASIPVLGPDVKDWIDEHLPILSPLTAARGMLLVYYHEATKTFYNFSTYMLFARLRELKVTLDVEQRTQTVSFCATTRDPHNFFETVVLQVNITREIGTGVPLRAPSRAKGRMATNVEEAVLARTELKLWRVESGEVLVEDVGLGSGLEIEGDVQWLETTE